MALSELERGVYIKLFNRGGYVLDFSTSDFDTFTLGSVGVALCEKYNLSKGRSLNAFINEADDYLADSQVVMGANNGNSNGGGKANEKVNEKALKGIKNIINELALFCQTWKTKTEMAHHVGKSVGYVASHIIPKMLSDGIIER